MNIEVEKAKLARFLKTGIVILSTILLVATGIYLLPQEITVSNSSNGRELSKLNWNKNRTKIYVHMIRITKEFLSKWVEILS